MQRVLNVSSALPRARPFALVLGLCGLATCVAWLSRQGLTALGMDPVWTFPALAVLFGLIYLGGLLCCPDEELRWCLGMLLPRRLRS